jgi:hypothetical protein
MVMRFLLRLVAFIALTASALASGTGAQAQG